MKCILAIIYLLLQMIQLTIAQNVDFVKNWGGSGAVIHNSAIFTDSSGNSISVGSFSGTIDINPGADIKTLTSTGLNDIFILKLDSFGNYLWSQQFGGTNDEFASSVITDKWGNSYITGWFKDSLIIGQNKLKSRGKSDTYILKINKYGSIIWTYDLVTCDMGTTSNQITFDQDQKIIISGGYGLENGQLSILKPNGSIADTMVLMGNTRWPNLSGYFLVQVDSMGDSKLRNYMWVSSSEYAVQLQNVRFDKRNLSYQVSNFNELYYINAIDGNNSRLVMSKGKSDIMIQKNDTSSQSFWGKSIGGSGIDTAYSLVIDEQNNIYISGSFESIVNFDEGISNTTLTSNGLSDAFIAKYDSLGNFKWVRQFGGTKNDIGKSLVYQKDKGLFLGGHFSEQMQVNINGNNNTLSSPGLTTGFLAKLDSSGITEWAYNYKGNGNSTINNIQFTDENNLMISGEFFNTVDLGFGFTLNSNWETTSAGIVDAFVEKILLPISIPTLTNREKNENQVGIYPNPNVRNGKVYLSKVTPNSTISIQNLNGNQLQVRLNTDSSLDLDFNEIIQGIYILKIVSEGKTQIEKLVIE